MSAPAADPTLDFLRSLDDPARYVKRAGVPIFKSHRRSLPSGEVVVDEKRLGQVASATNALLEDHGVPIPFGPGHRNLAPNAKETDQPPIWGFMVSPQVGVYGRKGTPAVQVTQCTRKKHENEVDDYPFRSPEFYPGTNQIRYVALLKRDPFLDMGVSVGYSAAGDVVCYQAEPIMADPAAPPDSNGTPPPAAPGIDPAMLDQLCDLLLPKLMAAMQAQQAATPPPAPAAAPAMPGPPPVQMESADGRALLQYIRQVESAYHKRDEERAAKEKAHAAQLAAITRQRDEQACITMLIPYHFPAEVVAREVPHMVPMTPEQRVKFVEDYMLAHYQAKPVGPMVDVLTGQVQYGPHNGVSPTDPDVIDEKQLGRALAYQRAHACEWEEALEKTRSSRG